MKFLCALWAAVVAAVAGPAFAAPLEAYGRLPAIEAAAISPDGSTVGLILTDGAQRRIVVQRLADPKPSHVLAVGDAKVRSLDWAGDGHLIFTSSKTGALHDVSGPRGEHHLLFDFNLATGKLKPLLTDADNSTNTIYGAPEVRLVEGKSWVFVLGIHFVDNQGMLTVFRVDLDTGRSRIVEVGGPNARDFQIDGEGKVIAQTVYDARTGRWALRVRDPASGWREARTLTTFGEQPGILGLGRDGRSVLMAEPTDDNVAIREVALDGTWGEPLPVQGADYVLMDGARHRFIGYHSLVGDEDRYTFLAQTDQNVWTSVTRAYAGRRVSLESWSDDHRKVLVRVDSPTEGPAYAVADMDAKRITPLAAIYDKLTPADIAPVVPVRFKAADGLALTGYLTTPRGVEAKGLPLVVFPHGGPAARDTPGFDWWAQAMASRGYAVLQVNFRGSTGYGVKLRDAGDGEWGRKMQTDLSDGVRFLAGQGTIDPKRVCIVGASYGGYAALAGVTLDPGVYRCAVSVAGISDLGKFAPWVKTQSGRASQRYLVRILGVESAKDPSLSAVSPAAHADKVSVPVLLVHGKDDTTVPLEQSRIMADALKAAHKPVEFVTLDSTDHWMSGGDGRLAMLQAVVAFLEKHNPPR